MEYVLILDNNQYKKFDFNSNLWVVVTSSNPSESDYLKGNTASELTMITELSWQSISDVFEISYYTDDLTVEEIGVRVETIPFTAEEVLYGSNVEILSYSDIDDRDEVILDVELRSKISFYDNVGDSFDVLNYTEDLSTKSSNLILNANYTPIDELDNDFDIVTWTNEDVALNSNPLLDFNINALPEGQFVVYNTDTPFYGSLNQLTIDRYIDSKPEGIIRVLISFDSGKTFKSFNGVSWNVVDTTNKIDIIKLGNTTSEINAIPKSEWDSLESLIGLGKVRFGFYIEESNGNVDSAKIDKVLTNQDDLSQTPSIYDSALYILNTTSTIQVQLAGRSLTGTIEDIDKTKVQYRVILNGNPYYPSDGSFTGLEDSPAFFAVNINHNMINMGVDNYLTVEFKDAWGSTDTWNTKFIGRPLGLIFKSPNGDFYSDEVGQVLKHLDIGSIIAGQTSIEHEIVLENTIGYDVENVKITSHSTEQDVEVELSLTQSPFLPSNSIIFPQKIIQGNNVSFFVRLKTDIMATQRSGAEFKLRVYADKVK